MYAVAERFKSVQGEGVHAGVPMAFIRFVGCSVGKSVCSACDTDFDKPLVWRGGGSYSAAELIEWSYPYGTICLTGGEPLNQNLQELLKEAAEQSIRVHIETSGTVLLTEDIDLISWLCVSPKPNFLPQMIEAADELKVIVPGLGVGEGWPGLQDALTWAAVGKPVFLQPRNSKFDVDKQNLLYVLDLLREYPQLRLSVQLHKLLHVQ
jgi:organic radical activating enzyme